MPSRRIADHEGLIASVTLFGLTIVPDQIPARSQRHTARTYRKNEQKLVQGNQGLRKFVEIFPGAVLQHEDSLSLHMQGLPGCTIPPKPLSNVAHKIDRAGQRHGDSGKMARTIMVYGRLGVVAARGIRQNR